MDRRAFIAGLVAGFAGCGSAGNGDQTATLTPAPVPTVTEAGRRTDEERVGPFPDVSCPDLAFGSPLRVCSHTAPEDAALVLVPRPVAVAVADGDLARPLRLTLRTRLGERLTFFTDGWRLFRRGPGGATGTDSERPTESGPSDGEWIRIDGEMDREGERVLDPGGEHAWVLGYPGSEGEAVTPVDVSLAPGVHAFLVIVRGESSGNQWACIAVFEVVEAVETPVR